jgi:hypothetical protein
MAFFVSVGCEKREEQSLDDVSPSDQRVTDFNRNASAPEARQTVRRKIEPHPQTENLKSLLTKDHTLCILAFDSIVRENHFIVDFHGIAPHQTQLVRDLVGSYEIEYEKLRNERSTILENAHDGDQTETALTNVSIKTLLLSKKIRKRIQREILTKKQRRSFHVEYQAKMIVPAREGAKQR